MQQLLQAIPGSVFFKDEAGRYLGCNDAFEQYVGFKRAALELQHRADEFSGLYDTAHDLASSVLRKAMRTKRFISSAITEPDST